MTILTSSDLVGLKARLDAATPGPWEAHGRNATFYIMSQHVRHPNANGLAWHDVAYLCASNGCGEEDALVIAHAPTDLRNAIETIEALRALLCEVRDEGLIYWEPQTRRGRIAKMEMLAKIDAMLAERAERNTP